MTTTMNVIKVFGTTWNKKLFSAAVVNSGRKEYLIGEWNTPNQDCGPFAAFEMKDIEQALLFRNRCKLKNPDDEFVIWICEATIASQKESTVRVLTRVSIPDRKGDWVDIEGAMWGRAPDGFGGKRTVFVDMDEAWPRTLLAAKVKPLHSLHPE